jgi:hypothetical protein
MDGLIHEPVSSGKVLRPSWKVVRTFVRIVALRTLGALRKHTVFARESQKKGGGSTATVRFGKAAWQLENGGRHPPSPLAFLMVWLIRRVVRRFRDRTARPASFLSAAYFLAMAYADHACTLSRFSVTSAYLDNHLCRYFGGAGSGRILAARGAAVAG